VPRFEPFAGIRYDGERVALDDVLAPPYDVISAEDLAELEARSPNNAVRLELPRDEANRDRYAAAQCRLDEWLASGVLVTDDGPSFYVYRMGFHDEAGRPRQTSGVIGALELSLPGEGDVLPHERTMSKPKDDRLNLLRACRANLSPVWGLSLAEGLSQLCELPGPPTARGTDEDGVHHRLWRITQPGVVAAIAEAVSSAPVVIADGHHRYETALHYRDERRQERGSSTPADDDLLMAYVVELSDEQLTVRPIHRLLAGLPDDFDLVDALASSFEVFDGGPPTADLAARMDDAGALGLVTGGQAWLLRPRGEIDADEGDADRLDAALTSLPPHEVVYQHGVDHTLALIDKGEAQAAVLLRATTVEQIASAARARRRMPAKSTFFYPKPRTGLVFRRLAG
jgi:uncharacterized protein (DUF1015 family)